MKLLGRSKLPVVFVLLLSFPSLTRGEKPCPVWHHATGWTVSCQGTTFAVTRLIGCEHLQMQITNPGYSETCAQAKKRVGAEAVMTGPYFDRKTGIAVDRVQKPNHNLTRTSSGRWMLVFEGGGEFRIVEPKTKLELGWTVVALGQRLVPYASDGFTKSFARRHTDRMAVGLKPNPKTGYPDIFIIRAKTDLALMAKFLEKELGLKQALNSDGGHVVRGKSPKHVAFLYRAESPAQDD